ncbi:hypothetical protein ACP70R_019254 [Stipagrostis hirtigluma subsp. patula]
MKRRTMDSRQGQPSYYKIFVKMTKTVALDVKCTDTVDQIKSRVAAAEGIDKSQQQLFFAGNHLKNDNRLSDYNINANCSVDLYVTDAMQIYVNIPSVGKIIKLNVKKSHSVADVKAAIEQKGGVPLNEQILMYAGQQLKDHQILSQFGLSNGQSLHVLVCPPDNLRISVKVEGGKAVNLDVKYWYTIGDVKLMIEALEGIPAFRQVLMPTQSGGSAALKDTETLQSQHIKNGQVLMLYRSVHFFIKTWEGKTVTMSMRTCDTTKEVKKKIEQKLPIKENFYYLHYRGRVLSPEDTLQKSKVEQNSTIDMRLRSSCVVNGNTNP